MLQPPTIEQWRQLYDLADRVQELAPWQFLYEDELFGVRDANDGQDGFVSVMGHGGDHFAIGFYLGAEALYRFWALSEANEDAAIEMVMTIRQLQLSFEARNTLEEFDRRVIKQLGRKYRGKHAWPMFRSFRPGYLPWQIDAEEAARLIPMLEQTCDVISRLAWDDTPLETPDDASYLMRIPHVQDGETTWVDDIVEILPPPLAPMMIHLDPAVSAVAQSLPKRKNETIEVDLIIFPQPLSDDDGRLYLPTLLLIVDAKHGMVLGNRTLPQGDDPQQTIANAAQLLLQQVVEMGSIPGAVTVRHDMAKELLAPLTVLLGWKVKVKAELKKVDEALGFMFSAMGLGDLWAEMEDDLMEMEEPPAQLLSPAAPDAQVGHRGPGKGKASQPAKSRQGKSNQPTQIFQLKITLKGARPPIWRRVLIPDNLTLQQLHIVIQIAMGWFDAHLHEFEIGGVSYGAPDQFEMMDHVVSEQKVKVSQVLGKGIKRFKYTYDFGDNWEHVIEIEKVLPVEPDATYPVCLTGKRACPPEDVGGVWGYEGLLEVFADPNHPEYEELIDWIGDDFDSTEFDIEEVNAMLAGLTK